MTDTVSNSAEGSESAATKRMRELLSADVRDRPLDVQAGYLDLFVRSDPRRSLAMFAMRSPIVTRIYERWWRPGLGWLMKGLGGVTMDDEHELANSMLDLSPGKVVLDLACGPGNFSRPFAKSVAPDGLVVGYDGSRPMLDRALEDSQDADSSVLTYVYGDATVLPFVDDSFDAVCCFAALHMFPQPFETLDEVARSLRPGGKVALLASATPPGRHGRVVKVLGEGSGQKMFRRDELTEALEQRGFEIETHKIAGFAQVIGARLK